MAEKDVKHYVVLNLDKFDKYYLPNRFTKDTNNLELTFCIDDEKGKKLYTDFKAEIAKHKDCQVIIKGSMLMGYEFVSFEPEIITGETFVGEAEAAAQAYSRDKTVVKNYGKQYRDHYELKVKVDKNSLEYLNSNTK